jgi:hypothetical protein
MAVAVRKPTFPRIKVTGTMPENSGTRNVKCTAAWDTVFTAAGARIIKTPVGTPLATGWLWRAILCSL